MEEKKWIFIEKSSETVRYKVGDSDSSMDSQDFEYIPTKNSPPPSTYEIIPSKNEDVLSGDEIEIHDNHFSSCPTSEMEDSDIEVVMKSPSSSETASLCSLNSQKSIPNDTCKYDDVVFNVDISEKLSSENEEEDSEVEVISRSIHRNGSIISISYVDDINGVCINTSTSGSENEEEIEETVTTLTPDETPEEEECHVESNDGTNEVSYVESIEDYGIKYLLEDLHVSRQINGRLVGLKTSTLALTVCLSITLGIYLGNYFGPLNNGDDNWDDTILVPEDVLHSTTEDPLRVNITFKYSSSTKESLRSVLNSFRKLKDDYDRLHTAYADMKDRCDRKKQMTFYWRKQVKKNSIEHKKKNVTADNILKVIRQPDTLFKLKKENVYNGTYETHQRTIRKLSRDLKMERNSAMYWRKRYKDFESSKENTCSKYDGPQTSYFSFSDCFNIFSKVIPSLDISAMNITNPAENLADQVQNAWSRFTNRWNTKKVRDDPVYQGKVNRFRKIFVISNVVNSDSHIHSKLYEDNALNYISSYIDPELNLLVNFTSKSKLNESLVKKNVVADFETLGDQNNIPNVCTETRNDMYNDSTDTYSHDIQTQSSESMDRIDWFRNKYLESQFLFDIFRWKNSFKNKIDMLKSRHIIHLVDENKKQSRKIEELHNFEKENIILKNRVKDSDEYLENTQSKLKSLITSERKVCNSSIAKAKRRMKRRYRYLVRNIRNNIKKAEKSKYNKRVHILIANERKRYYLSFKNIRKSIRKQVKMKFKRKLREIKELLKRDKKRDRKEFKMRYRNKKSHNKQKKHIQKNKNGRHSKYREQDKRYYYWNKTQNQDGQEKCLDKNKKRDVGGPPNKNQENGDDDKPKEEGYQKNRKKLRSRAPNERFQERHRKNKKHERSEKRKSIREKKLKRRIYNYAKKYKQSVKEVSRLRELYDDVVRNSKYQEEVVQDYKDKEDRYKAIIKAYEEKINEFIEREKQEEAVRLDSYNKLLRENARLKRSVVTLTKTSTNKELYIHINNKNENGEEVVEAMNNSEIAKDYMFEMSGSKCQKDTGGKPFYNINEVYPKDLFSKNIHINPPNLSLIVPDLHTPSSFTDEHINIPNPHTVQEEFFDSSPFTEELVFSGTNESKSDNEEVHVYWNEGRMEFNKNSQSEHNWYINWMEEREKNRKFDSFDSVPEKEGTWFWKAMKEREKLRSVEGEMNWFWKAMEEKKKRRSYQGEMNWFWKAMKEREKLREDEEEGN